MPKNKGLSDYQDCVTSLSDCSLKTPNIQEEATLNANSVDVVGESEWKGNTTFA